MKRETQREQVKREFIEWKNNEGAMATTGEIADLWLDRIRNACASQAEFEDFLFDMIEPI